MNLFKLNSNKQFATFSLLFLIALVGSGGKRHQGILVDGKYRCLSRTIVSIYKIEQQFCGTNCSAISCLLAPPTTVLLTFNTIFFVMKPLFFCKQTSGY